MSETRRHDDSQVAERKMAQPTLTRLLAVTLLVASSQLAVCHAHEPVVGPKCELALELVDADSGRTLPGIVQLRCDDGSAVELTELVNRGQGIEQPGPIHDWWVLAKTSDDHRAGRGRW